MDKYDVNVSRVETELMISWGVKSPSLFVNAVHRFQIDHPESGWSRTADVSRDGYLILIATRKAAS